MKSRTIYLAIILIIGLSACTTAPAASTQTPILLPTDLPAEITLAPRTNVIDLAPSATAIIPTDTSIPPTSIPPTATRPRPTATAIPATKAPAPTAIPPTAKPVVVQPTAPPAASGCPQGCMQESATCKIKGNISSDKEKIYHVPGGGSYTATKIDPSKGERWFCTEAEAQANGWRRAKN